MDRASTKGRKQGVEQLCKWPSVVDGSLPYDSKAAQESGLYDLM